MNRLGIYFGPKLISMVETRDKLAINKIQIPRLEISPQELLEQKVPEEVRIVTQLKEELSKANVEAKEAVVCLSGKDLIIRTFELPILSFEELKSAINFEVKKYIPFKVEDLISDSQWKPDKLLKRNHILFVGIKKEVLDKCISVLDQLGLKIISIEYSAFSILRLLSLANIKEKGIFAIIGIDLKEEDEVNFVVLEKGFPLFSRDITLITESERVTRPEEIQPSILLEKLKREIRISLDYYDRKYPFKAIKNLFFIMERTYQADLEEFFTFFKDMGLGVEFIDINKYIGKPLPFSLGFVKSYSCSLKINTAIKINLFIAKEKTTKEITVRPSKKALLISRFKVELIAAGWCVLILIATFLFGGYRIASLQKELKNTIAMRPKVSIVSPDISYDELFSIVTKHKAKFGIIDKLTKRQFYLTEPLDIIPRVIPKDIKLVDFSFKKEKDRLELILKGTTHELSDDKALELINVFLSKLKESINFSKYFKDIDMISVDHDPKTKTSNFTIRCHN